MGFFAELRRRHVLRAAALYGAVAWLLIQVTDVVSEPLGLPGWLLKAVIWLLAIGFPGSARHRVVLRAHAPRIQA